MPVAALENISIDAVSTIIESSFDDAKRSFETRNNTTWTQLATNVDAKGTDEVLHDFFENLEPMRRWTGSKKFQDLIERQYKTSHEPYEVSVKMRREDLRRRIRSQGLGAASLNITNKLAARAAQNDNVQVLAQYSNPTLLGYDGKPLFAADHPDGGGQANQNTGGGGQYWYLLSLDHGVKPVLRVLGEDYSVKDHADPETSENFFDRMLYWSVEFWGGYFPGLWQTAYRSNQALDADNLDAVIQAMAAFKDYHGQQLGIVPTHLLVGRSNWRKARQLLGATIVREDGSDGSAGVENIDRGIVDLIYSPLLP